MAPLIGISGSHLSDSVQRMIAQLRAGGSEPVFFDNHGQRDPAHDIAAVQGLVVMGNDFDIDPSDYIDRYPKDDPKRRAHPNTKSELACEKAAARARYENALLREALALALPVLTVCGGTQRLNVLCGGTLHQHVPDMIGNNRLMQHENGVAPHIPVLPVVIKPGTRLAMIAQDIKMSFCTDAPGVAKVIMENSLRHQSIDMLGAGLRISSLSDCVPLPDGTKDYLVEAVEACPDGPYAGQFLIGVQFHPEFAASKLGPVIIAHLIDAARHYCPKAS